MINIIKQASQSMSLLGLTLNEDLGRLSKIFFILSLWELIAS